MSTRLSLPLLAAAGALVLPQPGFAQEHEELTIPVGECLSIEDNRERFDCYERMVEAARAGSTASGASEAEDTGTPPAAGARQSTGQSDDGSFGFPVTSETREREAPTEIRSTVTAVEEARPNLLTVTLENGQVWRQMQSQRYNLRAGHHVRIYGTRWGDSYRLAADELYGFIQVERVK